MKNKKQFKQAYLLGDMLYKGSTLLRAKEAEELRAIGIPLYSASEQNKDGDINDKTNQTVESNNDLHAHIFKKDIDNIMTSDLIIANPERFAEGSICELGAVEMFNHIHKAMSDIVNSDLRDGEKVDLIVEWLQTYPYKTTYVHLADIRCTDLPESGYNRSFMMNQFVRGCGVAVQTGERGVPVSQGGVDIMSWEEIIEDLKEVTGQNEDKKEDVKPSKPTLVLDDLVDDLKDVPYSQWYKKVDKDCLGDDLVARYIVTPQTTHYEEKETLYCDGHCDCDGCDGCCDGFATVDVEDLERTMSLVKEMLSSPSITTCTNDIEVGDIIVIKDLESIKRDSNYVICLDGIVSAMDYGVYFTEEMAEYCGKGLEVVSVEEDIYTTGHRNLYRVKDQYWTYTDSMIAYIIKGGK